MVYVEKKCFAVLKVFFFWNTLLEALNHNKYRVLSKPALSDQCDQDAYTIHCSLQYLNLWLHITKLQIGNFKFNKIITYSIYNFLYIARILWVKIMNEKHCMLCYFSSIWPVSIILKFKGSNPFYTLVSGLNITYLTLIL